MITSSKEKYKEDQENTESGNQDGPMPERPYEDRQSRLKLPTLEEKRERDFIAVYRASKELEKVDREALFVWD